MNIKDYKPHKKKKAFKEAFMSTDTLVLLILLLSGIVLTIGLLLLSRYT